MNCLRQAHRARAGIARVNPSAPEHMDVRMKACIRDDAIFSITKPITRILINGPSLIVKANSDCKYLFLCSQVALCFFMRSAQGMLEQNYIINEASV